jgi:hypothetical protein
LVFIGFTDCFQKNGQVVVILFSFIIAAGKQKGEILCGKAFQRDV